MITLQRYVVVCTSVRWHDGTRLRKHRYRATPDPQTTVLSKDESDSVIYPAGLNRKSIRTRKNETHNFVAATPYYCFPGELYRWRKGTQKSTTVSSASLP